MPQTNGHIERNAIPVPDVQAVNRPKINPARSNLTHSQFLMWLGQQINPDAPLYNMIQTFTVHGAVDVTAFQRAFQAVVDGSDALRTVIEVKDGVPQQRVLAALPSPVELIDFSDSADPDTSYADWLAKRKIRLLRLDERLFDTTLVKLADDRFVWYLCQHHLITDGIAFALVYRYVADAYAKALRGALDTPTLPAYADFAAHTRAHRETDAFQQATAYWSDKTRLALPPTEFYGKSARGVSNRTERIVCDLGTERSQRLRAIAMEDGFASLSQDLSLFTIFGTLLLATIYRISGQSALRIGTPFHGRPTPTFKETIGLFIEIGPLQVTLDPDDTFVSLGEKVMAETWTSLRHAQPGISSADTNRAYDVLLNYVNSRFDAFAGLPVTTDWVHTGYGDANHNLRLQVTDFDVSGSFVLHFDVNTAVFGETERRWLVDHFLRVADAFVEEWNRPITDFDLLSPVERQMLLVDFNATDAPYPADETVIDLFEAQVARTPDAIAAVDGEQTISYANLNARANQLAHHLRARGVGPDTPVAVCLPRSIDALVAIWGVLKAGGAYIPIDPAYPAERIRFILADAQPAALLTHAALQTVDTAHSQFTIHHSPFTINLDTDWPAIAEQSAENSILHATPANLVYIIYTSGSTGQPKGTLLTHRGLTNYVCWAQGVYQQGEPLDFPLYSSLAFDLTVTSLFVPLISGSRIVIYGEDNHTRGLEILDVFRDDAVDVVKLTPAHLALVRETAVNCRRIRTLIVGGEAFTTELAHAIDVAFDGRVAIFNEYGPTEAVVGCMLHRYDPRQDTAATVPIGTPAANARIHVVDEHGQPVPPGVVGEMVIGGPGVARGYLNRPKLTAEKFVPLSDFGLELSGLPESATPSPTLYRTGDLARWDADGQLVFLGRRDHQVKIRGARIELGEVEAALAGHPAVESVVVDVVQYERRPEATAHCIRCGLPDNYPDADFDTDGVCADCRAYARYQDQVARYFRAPAELEAILAQLKRIHAGKPYDCVVLYSGGKDSTYMLYQLVRTYGMRPLVFSLDNGYISEEALANIRRICDHLEVELVFGRTPHMNAIFADSLHRHSNVCDGCYKTIYTLSLSLARRHGISAIITGLARGQLFETRLADTFRARVFDPDTIDQWVLDARRAYHQIDDAVNQLLDVDFLQDDRIFDQIRFVDFYRYLDVALDEVYAYLDTQTPWQRPSDTGRSTNCLINDAGIFIHQKERGYHNYALPYSWDVRLGHKQRAMAMHELDDDLNLETVRRMLAEVGYDENEKLAQRSEKRLVAYYVARAPLTTEALRGYLSDRLPEFMLPSAFVHLDALPLTANGKVDRRALPDPDTGRPNLETGYVAPSTERERELAAIWQRVFRLPEIGIHDNFFDLGGDSIISIQIVTQARQAGLHFAPRDLFDQQTIARLAPVARTEDGVAAEQGLVAGAAPLTPIQRWFFELPLADRHHWNQSLWLDVPTDVDQDALREALNALPRQHDALRLRFREGSSGWEQMFSAETTPLPLPTVDLSHLSPDDQDAAMQTHAAALEASLDLAAGPLLRAALFDRGPAHPARLFVTVHHLMVDGVSWQPLLADWEVAYRQRQQGQPISLPPKTTSFKEWADKLAAYSQSDSAAADLDHWQAIAPPSWPQSAPTGPNRVDDAQTVTVALSPAHTTALLQDVHAAYNTTVVDLLLAAWAQAFGPWSGGDAVTVMMEGHGRETEPIGDADVTRTVGWFTTHFPVQIAMAGATEPGVLLPRVKETIRRVPSDGLSYGALRYLHADAPLADWQAPNVLFNYLGQFERALPASDLFTLARPLQAGISPANERTHLLEVNAVIRQGQLRIDVVFGGQQFAANGVQALADAFVARLEALIDHCLSPDAGAHTPSDFALAALSDEQFGRLSDLLGQLDG